MKWPYALLTIRKYYFLLSIFIVFAVINLNLSCSCKEKGLGNGCTASEIASKKNPQKEVRIGISEIIYEPIHHKVHVYIKNNSDQTTKDLRLAYINDQVTLGQEKSWRSRGAIDEAACLYYASLDGKACGKKEILPIVAHSCSDAYSFQLNFKGAYGACFVFEIWQGGGQLEKQKKIFYNQERLDQTLKSNDRESIDKAFYTSAQFGFKDVLSLLIEKVREINKVNDEGSTALHLAVNSGHKEVTELLIAKGVDVNKSYKDGRTPLYVAAFKGYKELVELLIAKGADVNKPANDGSTPLHVAALEGHKELAELLIAKGADVNRPDNDGSTPLGVAVDGNHKELAELLVATRDESVLCKLVLQSNRPVMIVPMK
eukprot:gene126-172_t